MMSQRALVVAVVGGLVLGAGSRLTDHVAPRWVGDAAAVWVLAAFCAGALVTSRRDGARLGVTCLFTACATYYLWRVWVDERIWAEFLMFAGVFWFVASLLVGAAAGYAGAASRRDRALWGVVAGAFIGEALALWILGKDQVQIALELGVGLALFFIARIDLRRTAMVAVAVALTVAFLGVGYRLGFGLRRALRGLAYRPAVSQIKEGPPVGDGPSLPAILAAVS